MFAAVVYVILFLLKIRFPKNKSISTILQQRYGYNTLILFRQYEKSSKKLTKVDLDLKFLHLCKSYDVYPKFVQFKLFKENLYSSDLYKSWQKKLLDIEIKEKKKALFKLTAATNNLRLKLQDAVRAIDFPFLKNFIHAGNLKYEVDVTKTHHSKLFHLGISTSLDGLNPDKVIFNYSNYALSETEKRLLSFGLEFRLPVYKINFYRYFLSFENLMYKIKSLSNIDATNFNIVKKRIQFIAYKYFYGFKSCNVFSPIFKLSDINVLKNLGKNPSLVICSPDKGRGVVLMNKPDYIEKMCKAIEDRTKFKPISTPIIKLIFKIEDKINRTLNSLKKSGYISESTYNDLHASGSSPGILYGSPKTHKPNLPLRPILAAYNTPNFKLAKFLVPILKPLTINEYHVSNSYSFATELKNVTYIDNPIMVSFDVESLFTNIPLEETCNIILELLFPNNDSFVHGFSKKQFTELLNLATSNSYFLFNKELYHQIDGVAMGSPLGPTLANIFMCNLETMIFSNCPNQFKPLIYKRYVDDTFALFQNVDQAHLFLNYINSLHKNINFTCELEKDLKINFLDVTVEKSNNSFAISIYRKPSFSGLGMNYFSYVPYIFKINAIKTLVYRAYHLCSKFSYIDCEFRFLVEFFSNNCFPKKLIHNQICKFLQNIYQPPTPVATVAKDNRYILFPYLGQTTSIELKKDINYVLTKYFPCIKFNFIFNNQFKISSFFQFKDKLPKPIRSSILYKFTCPCSSHDTYIGSTKRLLQQRVDEHIGISTRTKKPFLTPPNSSIRDHLMTCNGGDICIDNFEILDSVKYPPDLHVLESIYIHKNNPSLNDRQSACKLHILS
jgi:hypothetical protein